MAETEEEIAALTGAELLKIADRVVRDGLREHLLRPERHLRNWDYGAKDDKFPCWTIASDVTSDTAIVYSGHGFGPAHPWGLVSLSNLWFGMDSGWFQRLEDAFVGSSFGGGLAIWDVVSREGRQSRVLAASLTLTPAFAKRDELSAQHPGAAFHVVYRSLPEAGVP